MSLYDVVVQRWRASLPSAAVDQFLAEQGAELRAELDAAERTGRDRRSLRAFQQWIDRQAMAGRDFDEVQLRWLDWMRQDIAARGELTLDHLGQGPYAQAGGAERATRIFGRRTLGDVVAGLNATLGWKPAGCGGGCGCGGKCGVSAGGCGCKGPRQAVDKDGTTALEPGEYETWQQRLQDELTEKGIAPARARRLARRLSAQTLRVYRTSPPNTDQHSRLVAEFAWLADEGLDAAAIYDLANHALDLAAGPPVVDPSARSRPGEPPRPGSAYTWHKGQPFHRSTIRLLEPDEIARARFVRTIHAEGTDLGVWDLGDGRYAAQTITLSTTPEGEP